LTQDQLDAIEKYGLFNLSDWLPKKPTPEQKIAIFEMFQASMDGELYDPARWSDFYKPYGFDGGKTTSSPEPVKAKSTPSVTVSSNQDTAPFDTDEDFEEVATESKQPAAESAPKATKTPQEILEMLRNRNKVS
jgi:hypothetical protein